MINDTDDLVKQLTQLSVENTNVRFNKKQMEKKIGKGFPEKKKLKLLNRLQLAITSAKTNEIARQRTSKILHDFMKEIKGKDEVVDKMIFNRRLKRLQQIYDAIPVGPFTRSENDDDDDDDWEDIPEITLNPKGSVANIDSPFMINFNSVEHQSVQFGVAGGIANAKKSFTFFRFNKVVNRLLNDNSNLKSEKNPKYYSFLNVEINAYSYEAKGEENPVFEPIKGDWNVANLVRHYMLNLPPYSSEKNNTTVLFLTYLIHYWPEKPETDNHATLCMITLTRQYDEEVHVDMGYIDSWDCGHDGFEKALHTAKMEMLHNIHNQKPEMPFNFSTVSSIPTPRQVLSFPDFVCPNPIGKDPGDCWALEALTAMFIQKNNFTSPKEADDAFTDAMEIPGYKTHMETLMKNTVAAAAMLPPPNYTVKRRGAQKIFKKK